MSKVIITGVPGGWSQGAVPPPRREINDLIQDSYQWPLYVQALAAMTSDAENNVISHYQLGGIHGLPYVEWDGSGGSQPVEGSGWSGYCTHGSVLFPTWHRPYVALYEQVLQNHAVQIADKYTTSDKAQWQNAAANLRAPYWDWASNSVPPAEVIDTNNNAQLTITGPDGQPLTITNPLLAYVFQGGNQSFPSPYSVWNRTLRHATSDNADAQDNVQDLVDTLQGEQEDITTSTYNMLTRVHTWPAFSNHTPGDGGSSSNSLEAIHDGIHVDVGGDGFMSDPSVAGLDPIFFLHHANVDRMLALWQALNPGTGVTAGSSEDGNWTIKANTEVNSSSSLTPFWNGPQSYWNSAETTNFNNIGYTYPEFVGLNMNDPNAVKAAIAVKVNQLYSGEVSASGSSNALMNAAVAGNNSQEAAQFVGAAQAKPGASAPAPAAGAPQAQQPISHPAPAPVGGGAVSHQHGTADILGNLHDWVARVRVKKYEIGGSFAVLIFIGDVPDDPKQWRRSPSLVGAHKAFVNSAAERCENCRNQHDLVTEGFVHLDGAITRNSGLHSLTTSVVEPYLKQNIHWRVQKPNGEVIPTANLKSLQVDILSTPLHFGRGDLFPHPKSAAIHHHGITAGRLGGHRA